MIANEGKDERAVCPYSSEHIMHRKRLQSHLIKCRLNYPNVELLKCCFNQVHLIPEPEYVFHVTHCPDKNLITQYKHDAPNTVEDMQRMQHKPFQCDENWDDDDTPDYDPKQYSLHANVVRQVNGILQPSEKKMFRKMERRRLGHDSSDEEKPHESKKRKLSNASKRKKECFKVANKIKNVKESKIADKEIHEERPKTPPPPTNIKWT